MPEKTAREYAQMALEDAREAQTVYWRTLANLEAHLAAMLYAEHNIETEVGVEGIDDLEGASLESLTDGYLETDTEECSSDDCSEVVNRDDLYFATPCGTFCSWCMPEHAKGCEICRSEFELEGD